MQVIILVLSILFALNGFAESSNRNLILLSDSVGMDWTAGSSPQITLKGSGVNGAVAVRYRWINESSKILNNGILTGSPADGFSGTIDVPKYSGARAPKLHFEIEGKEESNIYISGDEFKIPKIKGLIKDTANPKITKIQVKQGSWGKRIEISIQDESEISKPLVILNPAGPVDTVSGVCSREKAEFQCAFSLTPEQAALKASVQVSDSTGNITKSEIFEGANR